MASWESVVRIDKDPSSMVVNVEIVIVSVVNVCCKCRDVTSVHAQEREISVPILSRSVLFRKNLCACVPKIF